MRKLFGEGANISNRPLFFSLTYFFTGAQNCADKAQYFPCSSPTTAPNPPVHSRTTRRSATTDTNRTAVSAVFLLRLRTAEQEGADNILRSPPPPQSNLARPPPYLSAQVVGNRSLYYTTT